MFRQTIYDKADWNDGPWKQECDRIRWIDTLTGLPCTMHRNINTGTWSGFVGVSFTHPLFRVHRTDATYDFIDVHGGIFFTGHAQSEDVCFSPPTLRWWIGFQANTSTDIIPRFETQNHNAEYRDEEYVFIETSHLAQQLSLMDDYNDL